MTARDRVVEERLRLVDILRHQSRHPELLGHHALDRRVPFGGREVDQVPAVEVQDVEEERRERHLLAQRGDVPAARRPARGLLERTWPPVGTERDRLAVENDRVDRERQRRLHHLGHSFRDRVERPGEDPDRVAVAMHLDPDAVQLPVDRGGIADRLDRALRPTRPSSRASAGRAGRPPDGTARALRARPRARRVPTAGRSPASIAARRTAADSTPAARATASTMMPASAPCRSSPPASITRNRCSSAVARPNSVASVSRRSPTDPAPLAPAASANARSTSATVSVGSVAGAGRSRREAHPTPVRRWRSSPDR